MFKRKSNHGIYFDKTQPATTNNVEPKKPVILKNNTPTIIAQDLKLEGQILSTGKMEIEGMIRGNIKGNSVVLLQHGLIEGDVEADSFSVRGKFIGNIKAKNVNIGKTGEVSGVIEYGTLSVEDGASVDAKFKKIGS